MNQNLGKITKRARNQGNAFWPTEFNGMATRSPASRAISKDNNTNVHTLQQYRRNKRKCRYYLCHGCADAIHFHLIKARDHVDSRKSNKQLTRERRSGVDGSVCIELSSIHRDHCEQWCQMHRQNLKSRCKCRPHLLQRLKNLKKSQNARHLVMMQLTLRISMCLGLKRGVTFAYHSSLRKLWNRETAHNLPRLPVVLQNETFEKWGNWKIFTI